jgi:hypothetical protein
MQEGPYRFCIPNIWYASAIKAPERSRGQREALPAKTLEGGAWYGKPEL